MTYIWLADHCALSTMQTAAYVGKKCDNIYACFCCILPSYFSLSADYIRPRCIDDDPAFLRCYSGRLTFNRGLMFHMANGNKLNITQYTQLDGQYTNYRPICKALIPGSYYTNVYLFHYDKTWNVGKDSYVTQASVYARVNDTALRPEFITGVCQLYCDGIWQSDNCKLRCDGMCQFRCQLFKQLPGHTELSTCINAFLCETICQEL